MAPLMKMSAWELMVSGEAEMNQSAPLPPRVPLVGPFQGTPFCAAIPYSPWVCLAVGREKFWPSTTTLPTVSNVTKI